MKPKHIKKLLMSEIETVANASDKYCSNPGRDFSRKRKLSFKKVVESIIGMGSKGLTNELICLKLVRKQTKQVKELLKDKNKYRFVPHNVNFDYLPEKTRKADPVTFYELKFRIVRFEIGTDRYETVLTNLDKDDYPTAELKRLYAARWGIETSFRDLKYTLGMLDFHSKKVMSIHQEIYAHLIMYNFSEMITSHVVIAKKQRKYTYKANFSVAVHMCRRFFYERASPPDLETIIARTLIPIRPERHRTRNLTAKVFHGFLYRVA